MISHGFLLLFFSFILSITASTNYFKYTGPNLTTTENETFTEFYLINRRNVLHVTENVTFNHFLPKCCPPNYKYEKGERKCVRSNDTSIINELGMNNVDDVYLIKSGLRDCEVIVDHVLLLDDFKSVLGNYKQIRYKNETFASGKYCVDGIDNDSEYEKEFILRLCYGPEYCRNRELRCLKKCCPDGEIYIGRDCHAQPEYGFPTEHYSDIIVNFTDNFAIFRQKRKCKLHFPNITHENITIFENGSISYTVGGPWQTHNVEDEMYCFELGLSNNFLTPYLLMCNNIEERNNIKYWFSRVVMSLSCVCFIATMMVYVFLYKLKKVIHRIVFSYCLAQFTGFATLTYLQIDPEPPQPTCSVLGFLVLFGFHAGFSWLTVMCFDMWRTLGSMSPKVGNNNKSELKRTFYYCMYGWLVPSFITVFCYFENKYSFFPESLHAYIGDLFCLLEKRVQEGNYGHTMFFIIPITCAIIVNIIFFVLTVRYIIDATENVRKMSDTKKEKKEALYALKKRTFMALKLFLVMGINWSFEIISSIISFKEYTITTYIELFLDTFNCFQGVFVFLIFVLKWKVIKSIMEKFKIIVVSSVSRSTSLASTSG